MESPLTRHEEGFFHIFTAATLNHKEARFHYALFVENGIIPSPDLVEAVTAPKMKYEYLRYLVNPDTSLVFKYNSRSGSPYFNLSEFEADSKAQALANLYLSASIGAPYDLYDYESDPTLLGYSEAPPTGFHSAGLTEDEAETNS